MTKRAEKFDFQLIKQQRAVMSYLDSLLHEIEPDNAILEIDNEEDNATESSSLHSIEVNCDNGTESNKSHTLLNNETTHSTVTEEPSLVTTPNFPIVDLVGKADSLTTCRPYRGPSWAVNKFQTISFFMKGIGYVAPMEKLFGIIPMPDTLTLIPGRRPWNLGLHRNRGVNLQVIDLALILDGCGGNSSYVSRQKIKSKFILLLDNGRWGLVVDSVDSVLRLENQSVKWGIDQKTAATLVGTVIENMRIVVDIDTLVENLDRGYWG